MSAFLISIGLVVVFVVSVCVKLVFFFSSSQVTIDELVETPVAGHKESPSAAQKESASATLAKARADLIAMLLDDMAASEEETLLAGWTTPLGGRVEHNANLLSVIARTDANLPGLSVRDGEVTSYADVAQELIDNDNATTALRHELDRRSARRVPSSLVPVGCTNVRAEKTNWLQVGHNLPSKALNTVIIYGKDEEDVEEQEEELAVVAKEIEERKVEIAVVAGEGLVGRMVNLWSQA
ncbi:hypothetical protein HKX48_003692 [Thoreauomyces humboldtii]|nr:hypothetical protein HKX48_003692 [Thoreauomyces humboldtii]